MLQSLGKFLVDTRTVSSGDAHVWMWLTGVKIGDPIMTNPLGAVSISWCYYTVFMACFPRLRRVQVLDFTGCQGHGQASFKSLLEKQLSYSVVHWSLWWIWHPSNTSRYWFEVGKGICENRTTPTSSGTDRDPKFSNLIISVYWIVGEGEESLVLWNSKRPFPTKEKGY